MVEDYFEQYENDTNKKPLFRGIPTREFLKWVIEHLENTIDDLSAELRHVNQAYSYEGLNPSW